MGVVIRGHVFTPVNLRPSHRISVDMSLYEGLGYVAPLKQINGKIAHKLRTNDRSTQSSGIKVIQEGSTSE